MKQRLLSLFAMLSLMISGAMAQSLTVADITAEAGQEATITVAVEGAAQMTALQFNLSLPEGFTLAGDIALGAAAQGHTLSTNALASGDLLVVLYSLYQSTFADGTLLTIPVVAAEDAASGEARLYTVHTATAAAVSHTLSNVTFAMNVATVEPEAKYYWYVGVTDPRTLTPGNVGNEVLDQWTEFTTEKESPVRVSKQDPQYNVHIWYIAAPYDWKYILYNATGAASDEAGYKMYDAMIDGVRYKVWESKAEGWQAIGQLTITNHVPITAITLSHTAITMKEGEQLEVTATVTPENATNRMLSWVSSDKSVANCYYGKVYASAPGTATITVTDTDFYGNKASASFTVTVEKKVIAVSGIALDQTAATLTEGETLTLTATVSPDDATDKTVTWETSDAAIATVENGVVTAVASGEVTITAKAGDKEATCVVTVEKKVIAVSGITLDQTAATLTEGETLTLTATVSPDDATDKTVTWSTSDASVAIVVDGVVTAVAPGEVTITAKAGEHSATCVVTVEKKVIAVSGIALDQTAATLTEGETLTLVATVSPDDATDKTVTWETSDAAIATVVDGVVTAVAPGEVTITAKAGDKEATCVVTVEKKVIAVSGIALDQTAATLTEGETLTLTATVSPDDATDKTVTWETSDAAIATVENGVVTALAPGTATITAKAGDKEATCVVTVEKKVIAVSGIALDQTAATLTEGETLTLTATVSPDDATDKTMTWETSDAAIATVVDGVVTAVAPGEVTITAKAGEHSATCVVTVKAEKIVDLDMTHKVSRDWEGKTGNVTIDGIAMSERYEGNADPVGDQLWQTVTGLENGKYTVKVWANARVAWVGSPATDGQEELTYIFANNVEKSIAVLHNPGTNGNVLRTLEGVEVTDGTLRMGMTKKAAGSNWHFIQIESLTLHATNAVIANIAKVDLKAALDAANAVSPKKDDFVAAIAAAQDVYDNSKDAEEVKAAVATLKEATKLAILMNATEENPVLTDFVVNGTFDAGTTGWKSTTGAANQGTATNQQGAFTGAFFENWNGSNYTGKLYQVIENVPNGIYELSICAFVETFDASAQFVYANADKVALTTGAPTAYTVRTIVENNTIEVGFEQTAAVNRWCGIDNVSLTYLGEASNEAVVNAAKEAFTAAYEEFGAAFVACKAMMLKTSYYEIDDAAYQLNEQLATTTDVDALNAMTETLIEATAALNEINEVYAAYDVFVQRFKAAAEISEPMTTEAAELLEYNMSGGAGMQAASLEALAEAAESIKSEYLTYVANAKLLDGNKFDLTYLIQNPNIDHNLDGWTLTGRVGRLNNNGFNGVPGIMEIGEWGASAWEAGVSQTLNELPNGKYIVKMAWMAASGIKMNLTVNEASVEVTGIGDQGGNIAADGSVVEMGQGVQGWQYAEVEALVEDGTLTIAVNSSSAAQYQWSNADQFQLYYAGSPESTGIAPSTLNLQTEFAGRREKQPSTEVYDLTGRRVTDTKGLKGIYIVNGKKKLF